MTLGDGPVQGPTRDMHIIFMCRMVNRHLGHNPVENLVMFSIEGKDKIKIILRYDHHAVSTPLMTAKNAADQ